MSGASGVSPQPVGAEVADQTGEFVRLKPDVHAIDTHIDPFDQQPHDPGLLAGKGVPPVDRLPR